MDQEQAKTFQGGLMIGTPPPRALTSEVTPKHKVKNKKAILVVLEGITQVDDERVIDL